MSFLKHIVIFLILNYSLSLLNDINFYDTESKTITHTQSNEKTYLLNKFLGEDSNIKVKFNKVSHLNSVKIILTNYSSKNQESIVFTNQHFTSGAILNISKTFSQIKIEYILTDKFLRLSPNFISIANDSAYLLSFELKNYDDSIEIQSYSEKKEFSGKVDHDPFDRRYHFNLSKEDIYRQFTEDEKRVYRQEVIKSHNYLRSFYNIPQVTGNPQIDNVAQRYAEEMARRCQQGYLEHSSRESRTLPQGSLGENIAFTQGYYYNGEVLSESFFSEINLFNHKYPNVKQQKTGHYTQLVWKSSTQIGSGISSCVLPNGQKLVYYVINYFSAGNVIGTYAENVFEPKNLEFLKNKFPVDIESIKRLR